MIDALLYAVRDAIRYAGPTFGYGRAECEIVDDEGVPPPKMGNVFVGVHGGTVSPWNGCNDNNLAEVFGFSVTLTMRLGRVSLDRVGDQLIARNMVRTQATREGFWAKAEQLRSLLHMNWPMTVLVGQAPPAGGPASANDNISAWCTGIVYGFVEPARYRGPTQSQLVGGEWFGTEEQGRQESFGIKARLRFDGAKRLQPQTQPVGPFA